MHSISPEAFGVLVRFITVDDKIITALDNNLNQHIMRLVKTHRALDRLIQSVEIECNLRHGFHCYFKWIPNTYKLLENKNFKFQNLRKGRELEKSLKTWESTPTNITTQLWAEICSFSSVTMEPTIPTHSANRDWELWLSQRPMKIRRRRGWGGGEKGHKRVRSRLRVKKAELVPSGGLQNQSILCNLPSLTWEEEGDEEDEKGWGGVIPKSCRPYK